MTTIKQKICKECKCKFTPIRSTLERFCSFECMTKFNKENPKENKIHRIPQVSEKRKIEQLKYSVLRTEFLGKPENQICPITKQPTTDIHHKKGRVGNLFLNTEFWIALSREGHKFVEENPEWAKLNGYSLNRLSND